MNNKNGISFPSTRMRRTRRTDSIRRLVEETTLSASDLIYPVFLLDGENKSTPIQSFFHNNPLPSNNIFGYGFIKIKTKNKIPYF